MFARIGLPRLIEARNLPRGTNADTMAGEIVCWGCCWAVTDRAYEGAGRHRTARVSGAEPGQAAVATELPVTKDSAQRIRVADDSGCSPYSVAKAAKQPDTPR